MPTLVTTRERERDELETTVNLIETRFTHSPQWGNDCRREKMWLSLVMGGRCGIWRNKNSSRCFGAHVSDHVYYQTRQDVYKCILVWQLSNKAADKTDPFIRRRLPPAPFSCRDKTVRTQWMQEAAYSRDSQQKWKLLNFETPQIVGHPNNSRRQTPSGHTPDLPHEPQYKVIKSFAQIWPNEVVGLALCGQWAKWK